MATEIGAGIREETARELVRLRKEVLMAKQELQDRFEYFIRMLHEKHIEMEAQLDEVVRVAETEVADRQIKLNQLTVGKVELLQTLQHNELNEIVINVSRDLDEGIQGLEAIVDQIPSVWLEWRDEWFVDGMAELCRVYEGVSYVNRHNPVCSGVNEGKGQNEIDHPNSLSTDRNNGDVYVCQVFSREGIHQRDISPQELFRPSDLTVTHHQLFVRCSLPDRICKLDKLSGSILCSVNTENSIRGLSADSDTLYAGMYVSNQICNFSLEDLTTIRITPLNSPYLTQDTALLYLKKATSLFVVLFGNCNYPIQTFSKDGNLIQVITSRDQLIDANYLCVDRHLNIIVSDTGADKLIIYSIEGHLLTAIGQRGEGPGRFYCPRGIDEDKEGRIVVVDFKPSHKLQFF